VPTTFLLGSAIKDLRGTMGFGAGVELPIARKLTLFGDVSFMRLRLSDSLVEGWYRDDSSKHRRDYDDDDDDDETDEKDSDLDSTFIRSGTFIESKLGARYYTSPGADSWYA